MRFPLIMTDIDGTLLNEESQVTDRTRQTLTDLVARGATVVLATARPPRRIRALHANLGLTGPVIAYNGAIAFYPTTGQALFAHTMAKEVALRVLAAIRAVAPGANPGLELEDHWHVDQHDPRYDELFAAGRMDDRPAFGQLEPVLQATDRGVCKLYFFGEPAVRSAFEQRLAAQGIRDQVFITSSGPQFIEILAGGVNKGSALRALAAILGVPREQTVFLGDEEADVPALREAGLAIAMGQAPAHVKAAAGAVTGPNTSDGWADAIERFVLVG